MALIVEDGTGLETAESYLSVADADTYVSKYVFATTTCDAAIEAAKEKALRLATQYLDNEYKNRWKGDRTSEEQALAWPRAWAYDEDGYLVLSDELPQALKNACAEMAVRALSVDPMVDLTDDCDLKAIAVEVGPLKEKKEYQGASSVRPGYDKVDAILAGLIHTTSHGGVAERA